MALVVLAVVAGADRAPPGLVLAIPLDGALEPGVEADGRLPPEALGAVGGERVPAVVAGAVGDVGDQRLVAAGELQDPLDDVDVGELVGPADVVDLARLPALEHDRDRAAEVAHVEPVADLHPVAVDGQRVARERVQDAERDQLLRVLARAVVVGGAADQGVGAVGVDEGADEKVAAGLRGRVGRGGLDRRGLGEGPLLDRAVDLVGRDLQVADARVARGVEQHEGAEDVGGDELARGLDRAVDVRLGGEVDDGVAALDRAPDGVAVGDVALDQLEAIGRQALEVLAPARVGELVEHPDRVLREALEAIVDEARADEAGAAGDEQPHCRDRRPRSLGVCSSALERYSASPRRHCGSTNASRRSERSTE